MSASDNQPGALQRAALALRQARERIQTLERAHNEEIAIVGIGCRLPGGVDGPQQLWQRLCEPLNAVVPLPQRRGPQPHEFTKANLRAGWLTDVDRFDAAFFGISPREAEMLDPQHRLLLEVSWAAIEDASLAPYALAGVPVGVFVGLSGHDYELHLRGSGELTRHGFHAATGNGASFSAGRISHLLGLQGPCLTLDTACSSSLVAIHLACQSLRAGECELALAGGANLIFSAGLSDMLAESGALSADGTCRAFGSGANGYVRGEGCGVVVLKRLSDAKRAGDEIWACIRGGAVNHNGRSTALTAPNLLAQQELLERALRAANVRPDEIDYVETHGTGTALGDPIEFEALRAVLGTGETPCYLGALKTNFGHLEAAAGVAGVIKAALALTHASIPANLHFQSLNPHIAGELQRVRIPTALTPWPERSGPRLAGVTSMGLSGTNAHLVLVQAPASEPTHPTPAARPRRSQLLALSAATRSGLRDQARTLAAFLQAERDVELDAVALTLGTLRQHGQQRVCLVAADASSAMSQLTRYAAGADVAVAAAGTLGALAARRSRVAFLCSGESWTADAARELLESEPVFRQAFDACENKAAGVLGFSLRERIGGEHATTVALHYALATLWESWGVSADVVVGHGLGEWAAALVAGSERPIVRATIDPSTALPAMLELGVTCGLEIGRDATLSGLAARLLPDADVLWQPSLLQPGAMRSQLLRAAGELHVRGQRLDWNALTGASGTRRIPGYSFAASRYWVESEPRSPAADAAQVSAVVLDPAVQTWLGDHRVFERVLFPATGYLALAADACRQRSGHCRFRLEDVVFIRPLQLDAGVRVETTMLSEAHTLTIERVTERERVEHASAKLGAESGWMPGESLTQLRGRIDRALPLTTLYEEYAQRGVQYGPMFRGLGSAWRAENEALAVLDVPSGVASAVLLDTALQCLFAAFRAPFEPETYVPRSIDSFEQLHEPNGKVWVHATRRAPDSSGELQSYDLTLFDERGRAWLRFEGLTLQRVDARSLAHAPLQPTAAVCYRIAWQPQNNENDKEQTAGSADHWLIIADKRGVGAQLQAGLTARGLSCACTVLQQPDRESAEAVIRAEAARARALGGTLAVAYLRGLDVQPSSDPLCGELLVWLQALVAVADGGVGVQLRVVTAGASAHVRANDAAGVWQAPLHGLCEVIRLEHPELDCRTIDCDPVSAHPHAELLAALLESDNEPNVAWRDARRLVPRLVRWSSSDGQAPVSADSSYFITGGTGALGLHVARWLASRGAGHIMLASRSAPDVTVQRAIAALQADGTHVQVVQLDVSDRAALQATLAQLPALRGVVHAAGIVDDAPLHTQSAARFASVMAPKVTGAWNLHALTRDLPLDFFVLFSSLASAFGAAGQGSYAAGNAFMDRLAQYRRSLSLPATSINWGPWAGPGLAQRSEAVLAKRGLTAMPAQAALAALESVVHAGEPHMIVADLAWERLFAEQPGAERRALFERFVTPVANAQQARAKEPRWQGSQHALQELVAKVLRRVLGTDDDDELNPQLPLRDQGLDSLAVVQLRNDLGRALGERLPVGLLFDYPTQEALVAGLATRLGLSATTAIQLPDAQAASSDAIAIVAMACRFPGGLDSPEQLWELLCSGGHVIEEVPPDRWDVDAYYDPNPDAPGKTYARHMGALADVAGFDANFFKIAPREAAAIDPQQRILLEVSWEALERAGIDPTALAGTPTGVFVGMMRVDYADMVEVPDALTATGSAGSTAAGRISYLLGLEGPSMVVDTACSSGLVALHLACASLRNAEAELALVGGVNLILSPRSTIAMSNLRALAPDGRCKAFDAAADGYVRSEGCGVLVLERLADAQRNGHEVLAIIRGSALNQDGRSNGFTAPSGRAQQAVIRAALQQAGVPAASIGYVEAHGTGTPLGDGIELTALEETLGRNSGRSGPLRVGSIKTNLGHLEAAAGIAGLIKTVLSLGHGLIPRHLHFAVPNPHLPWADMSIAIPTENVEWTGGETRRAGVSSFGMSGTNAHVILEAAPPQAAPEADAESEAFQLVPISARTPEALRAYAARLAEQLGRSPTHSLASLSYALRCRRAHYEHRLALVAQSRTELAEQLRAVAQPATQSRAIAAQPTRVVFVFPGHGSQWLGMARTLLTQQPAFRASIERCSKLFDELTDWNLLQELAADGGRLASAENEVVQPTLFAISVALAEVWRAWGIEPAAVIGHSMGEIAAACVAGMLSLEDAAKIVCRRSQVLRQVTGQGGMVVLDLAPDIAEEVIAPHRDRVGIAVSNSVGSCVLSGELAALQQLVLEQRERGVMCRWVKVEYASHSPQMESLRPELRQALAGVESRAADVPMYSTVLAQKILGSECGPEYWIDNLCDRVRFAEAVQLMLADGYHTFIELSPHPLLTASIEELCEGAQRSCTVVGSLRRDVPEMRTLLQSFAALYEAGAPVNLAAVDTALARPAPLPTYPWQHEPHWLSSRASQPAKSSASASASRVERSRGDNWLGQALPELAQLPGHRIWQISASVIREQDVCERAWDIDMFGAQALLALAAAAVGASVAHKPFQLGLESAAEPVALAAIEEVQLTLVAAGEAFTLQAFARQAGAWQELGRARLGPAAHDAVSPSLPLDADLQPMELWRAGARMQECGVAARGFTLQALALADQQLVAEVSVDDLDAASLLLRAAAALYPLLNARAGDRGEAHAVSRVEHLIALQPPRGVVKLVLNVDANTGALRMAALDDQGACCAWADGVEMHCVQPERLAAQGAPVCDSWFYESSWQATQLEAPELSAKERWLVLGDSDGPGATLAAELKRHGSSWVCADPSHNGDWRKPLQQLLQQRSFNGIVCLWPLSLEDSSIEQIRRGYVDCAQCIVELARLCAERPQPQPRIWIVTRRAVGMNAAVPLQLAQSPVWGLGRVLALEHPELWGGMVDLGDGEARVLASRLLQTVSQSSEDLVAWRDGEPRALRLERATCPDAPAPTLHADRTYWITGGLGGLGGKVARWLVAQGARHVLLSSRRGLPRRSEWQRPQPAELRRQIALVKELEAAGALVQIAAVSVDDLAAMRGVLAALEAPLAGVFHAAGSAQMRAFDELDAQSLEAVGRAKIEGAWVLHELTKDLPIEYFVLFSSITAVWGGRGEGHYAAANHFLDALAHHRRASGLPATSIDWGYWATPDGLGNADTEAFVRAIGTIPLPTAPALQAFGRALGANLTQPTIAWIDWQVFAPIYSARRRRPLLSALTAQESPTRLADDSAPDFAKLSEAEARALIEAVIATAIGQALGLTPGKQLARDRGFMDAGMDSVMAVQFINRVNRGLGTTFRPVVAFEQPTIRELTDLALAQLREPAAEPAQDVEPSWRGRLESLLSEEA